MVISSVNTVTYNGDGETTAWPYTFPVTDDSEIRVQLNNADGTAVIIESDYYVDLVNSTVYYPGYAPGSEPPEAEQPPKVQDGQTITVYREIPITQESDLGEKWPFEVIEKGLDKLTMIAQQIDSGTNRKLDDTLASMFQLAGIVTDSGKLQHITDQYNAIDSNAAAAAESEENAAASATAASTSATNAANSATSATNTAAALTAYLDTKETLTAPAVDATLSISGAASDAKVTGDLLLPITTDTTLATFNQDDYLGTSDETLTATFSGEQVTLVFTDTANPVVYFGFDQELIAGQEYILTFELVSGSIGSDANQTVGVYNNGTYTNYSGTVTTRTFSGSTFVFQFTPNADVNAFRLSLVYSSKTVVVKKLRLYKVGSPKTIVNANAVKDLSEESFDEDVVEKINAAGAISSEYIPTNYFDFSDDAVVYKGPNTVSVTFPDTNKVKIENTENANPRIIFLTKYLTSKGDSYSISFKVVKGTITNCKLRSYLADTPTSGTELASFVNDGNGVWTATYTSVSSYEPIIRRVLDFNIPYTSKEIVLDDIKFYRAGETNKTVVADVADNANVNFIESAFLYSTESSDCSILKIHGSNGEKVVMVDSGINNGYTIDYAWNAINKLDVTHIDYFILSHWHSDHCGLIRWWHQWGFIDADTVFYLPEDPDPDSEGLMREDNPDRTVVARSQEIIDDIDSWGCTKVYPSENDVLTVNECKFVFWNTDHTDYYAMAWVDYNECSLCCTMVYGKEVMQFTGDIGTVACGKYYDKLYKCNIFKANHHAFGYPVVPRFMSAVCPEIVVTMAGSNIVYSTNPTVQAGFATNTTGLQQWCEDEFVPNYVTAVIGDNIYLTIDKDNFRFDTPARRCVRADEGIPVT